MIALGTLNWEGFPAEQSKEQRVNILNEFQYVVPLCLNAPSALVPLKHGETDLAGSQRHNRHNVLLGLMWGVDHVHVIGHGIDGIVR